MTTAIQPGLGHGAIMTQGGVGASPGYDAVDARRFWSVGRQEGAIDAGSYAVSQRAAGANMSVDIAATTGDGALVQGDAVTAQGLYYVPPHTAVINEAVTAAHATLPRVEQVVLELKDNQHDASGSNQAQVRVVAGTATSGATLDNRTGAAALPASAMLLADVLVGAAAASITNTVIRDRRKWARGAYCRIIRNTGDYATSSGTFTEIDTTNLKPRIECSGVPLRVRLLGTTGHQLASNNTDFELWVDGARAEATRFVNSVAGAFGDFAGALIEWDLLPAAGSHRISPAWATSGGTSTQLSADTASSALLFVVEELVRQNTPNNATPG